MLQTGVELVAIACQLAGQPDPEDPAPNAAIYQPSLSFATAYLLAIRLLTLVPAYATVVVEADTVLAVLFANKLEQANKNISPLHYYDTGPLAKRIACSIPKSCAYLDATSLLSSTASASLLEKEISVIDLLQALRATCLASLMYGDKSDDECEDEFKAGIFAADVSSNSIATVSVEVEPADRSHGGPRALFKSDAVYWLVGLAGDMGRSFCNRMMLHGARHIVFSSRDPKLPEDSPRNWSKVFFRQVWGGASHDKGKVINRKREVPPGQPKAIFSSHKLNISVSCGMGVLTPFLRLDHSVTGLKPQGKYQVHGRAVLSTSILSSSQAELESTIFCLINNIIHSLPQNEASFSNNLTMQFTNTVILLVSFTITAIAKPVSAPAPETFEVARTDLSKQPLASRDLGAVCGYLYHPSFPYIGIYMPNNLMSSAQGTGEWGGGFIDNLRGKETAPLNWCNPIGWQAVLDDAGTGLAMVFNVELGCTGRDVARALHAASGQWIICADDLGADVGKLASVGASVAGILAGFIKV
ncbi:uncharacterized protein RAG0_14137 [Rhynchosporium agropyri]|uniref:Ketoreductase (KR) domain-containing protein n=1 Tax=Rhynchosporium agropyri TaxID=914238 RepID=A0A1E1LFM8_9HELO|nr:uncharacterized protein RAG0_14137 [Rhynchosporium agropyri]